MHSKNLRSAIRAIVLVASFGFGGVAAACCAPPPPPPSPSEGLTNVITNGTDLSLLNIVGNAGGSFASGGNFWAGDVKRFALPGQGYTGAAAAPGGKAWNAWFAYSHSNVGYSFAPLTSSGTVKLYIGGVDYTFDNSVVFGVAVAADRTDVDLNFVGGKLDGSGTTVAPYIGIPLNKQWALDATLGYGRTNVDSLLGPGAAGSTHTNRSIGSLGLSFRESIDKWQLTGRGAYLQAHDKLGAYTLTNGTFVPDGTVNVSQFRLYGQVAYDAGTLAPYVGLSYIYDVHHPDQLPVGGLAAANDRDAWTPAIGVRFKTDGSVYGSIQYSTERGRSEVKNNQFLVNIGVRF
jgi:hypothetical protein